MPLPEKLARFETLWSELSSEPEQIEIPQCNKDILDERVPTAERGEIEVIDWEVARRR